MISWIRSLLALKHLESELDIDDPNTTLIHREIILSKPFLKEIYLRWYSDIMARTKGIPNKKIIEIGSGGGFLKDVYPEVITSDIMPLNVCDMVFSAEELPFENESIGAILMVNVFHHIPDCLRFLNEAKRTLCVGGKIVLVEPYNCFWSSFIYKTFHHETIDMKEEWKFKSTGPLSGSNIFLPYIVFERDRDKFLALFPEFKINRIDCHTPFSYLLSGGVSLKTLVPSFAYGLVTFLDSKFSSKNFNMFATYEIEKVA